MSFALSHAAFSSLWWKSGHVQVIGQVGRSGTTAQQGLRQLVRFRSSYGSAWESPTPSISLRTGKGCLHYFFVMIYIVQLCSCFLIFQELLAAFNYLILFKYIAILNFTNTSSAKNISKPKNWHSNVRYAKITSCEWIAAVCSNPCPGGLILNPCLVCLRPWEIVESRGLYSIHWDTPPR